MTPSGTRMHFSFGNRRSSNHGTNSSSKRGDIGVRKASNVKLQSSLGRTRKNSFQKEAYINNLGSIFDYNATDDSRDDMDVQKEPKEDLRFALGGGELRNNNNDESDSLDSFLNSTQPNTFLFPLKDLQNDDQFLTNHHDHVASVDRATNYDHAPFIDFDAVENNRPSPVGSKLQEQSSYDSKYTHPFLKTQLFKNQSSTRHKNWTKREDTILRRAMANENDANDWVRISSVYFDSTRSATQCKTRWTNYVQPGVLRGGWMPSEDKFILDKFAEGLMWKEIAEYLPGRRSDSVRDRYVNHLDPSLKKSPWTQEEDEILFKAQLSIGNKWSEIRKSLPGRSVNSVKNRFHNNKKKWLKEWNSNQMTGAARPPKRIRGDDQESTTNPLPHLVESLDPVITI